jgi:hypothetical protein
VAPRGEMRVRKMAEKYRRADDGTPSHLDVAKLIFNVEAGTIEARYHAAAGCVGRASRLYSRATGAMTPVTRDPAAPLAPPRAYDVEQDFRRACTLERECHVAARAQAKMAQELAATRAHELQHPELEKTLAEIGIERAERGEPVQEQQEAKAEADDGEPDFLLPFLLAAKCANPNAPTEKEAKKADRDSKLAFKERLHERAAIIQRRLEEEQEKLLRRQQAFARSRDHTESTEAEFEAYQADANFRISILEQRLERHAALQPKAIADLEARLRADERLMIFYDPRKYQELKDAQ